MEKQRSDPAGRLWPCSPQAYRLAGQARSTRWPRAPNCMEHETSQALTLRYNSLTHHYRRAERPRHSPPNGPYRVCSTAHCSKCCSARDGRSFSCPRRRRGLWDAPRHHYIGLASGTLLTHVNAQARRKGPGLPCTALSRRCRAPQGT